MEAFGFVVENVEASSITHEASIIETFYSGNPPSIWRCNRIVPPRTAFSSHG
jgi:hypothetical protein